MKTKKRFDSSFTPRSKMIAIDPVFNEPSAAPLANDRETARRRMDGVLAVLLPMPDHGLGKSLRVADTFYQLPLAPDYALVDWLNDRSVDRDKLNFFLSLAAKQPYLRKSDGDALQRLEDTEVACCGQSHPAFLAAHALDAPLVSFEQDAWSSPNLPVTVTRLDSEGELCEEADTLVNFSSPSHFDHHAPWFARRNTIKGAADLWSRRSELFPHLTFCPSVEEQLACQESILARIIDRLQNMEQIAKSGNAFDNNSFAYKCHATSTSTFQKFTSAYKFTTPCGVSKQCGWHFYLPDGRRIYFSSDYTIGHIGNHLPTVNFH